MSQPPKRPSSSGGPPTPPSAAHDRQALLKAYQDVVKDEHDRGSHGLPVPDLPSSRAPFWIVTLTTVAVATALLVGQPAWLFPRAPKEPPVLEEASLRVRMYIEIERIEQFRATQGRLPSSLLEAKGDTTGLQYATGGEGYSLTGRNAGIALTYTSSQAPREFVGNSYDLIRRRGTS
jgi:hypothetical protein